MEYVIDFGQNAQQREIFDEIREERVKQDSLWGTKMDNQNTPADWAFYIIGYLGNLYRSRQPLREVMIRVAALAIAAIEAEDRRNPR